MAILRIKVVEDQIEDLSITLQRERLEIIENSNDSLPRMAYFRILCENNSDIPFNVERLILWIELRAESLPERNKRSTYPVADIREDAETLTDETIGWVHGTNASIGQRESNASRQVYDVEFQVPSWMEDVARMYVFGFLEVQGGVTRPFQLKVNEGSIQLSN